MFYPRLLRSRVAYLSTLALCVVVAVGTLTPIPQAVSIGGGDKLHHVLGFMALAFPVAALRPRWIPVTALAMAFYGGAIELIQPYVGRECEFADWTADIAGIILGSTFGFLCNRMGRLVMGLPLGGGPIEGLKPATPAFSAK